MSSTVAAVASPAPPNNPPPPPPATHHHHHHSIHHHPSHHQSKEQYQHNWRPKVPALLLAGDTFDRYDDDTNCLDLGCSVRLEEYGFYLVWEPRGKDAGQLDVTVSHFPLFQI